MCWCLCVCVHAIRSLSTQDCVLYIIIIINALFIIIIIKKPWEWEIAWHSQKKKNMYVMSICQA